MKPIAKRTFHNCQASNIFIIQKLDMSPTNCYEQNGIESVPKEQIP